MTLNQILQFFTVCQYCNFTKAAEALHLSQPGVSKSIRELEAECGTALFERHYNNISMTRSGEVLYEKAQRFMEHYRDFEAEAHALSALQSTLHIGVVPMCGNTVFPKLHAAFLKAYPESRIATVEDTASMLYDMLDQHELDFILCVTNHLPDAHYHYHVVKKSRLKLFVAASSPLADRTSIELADLRDVPLVLFPDHFGQTRYIRRLFQAQNIYPAILHQTNQVFTILEYIRSGAAAGFLSEEFAAEEPDLIPLTVTDIPPATINLVWNRDLDLYPSMQHFLRTVKQLYPTPKRRQADENRRH